MPMSKRDPHLVVGFFGEVVACFEEDVSDDVNDVNPTHTSLVFWCTVNRYLAPPSFLALMSL